ncbi:propanediol utilization system propionate kinase GrpG, partial [Escherichia coli]|nr:propanediol utilization system propionate kinase GrpG [Escherichia coli]
MSLACVLVINCGSSSMKFSVIPQDADQPLLSGLAERLGIDHAVITFKDRDGHKSTVALDDASHQHALKVLFAKLDEQQLLEAINAVGHRVAHGGSDFKRSVLVTDDVIEKVRALSVLAPLHNPANLIGIEAARAL